MPRNDQVTRQWHLLRRLEGSTGLTLQALAGGLPADQARHLRTIRLVHETKPWVEVVDEDSAGP